jgi:hypothetical protein
MPKKIFLLILCFPLLALPSSGGAQSAGPSAILSWKARSYAPASYTGKILPSSNTPLIASLDVFESGKAADLSGLKIYWYLGNTLVDRGVGLQTISVRAPRALGGGTVLLRAQIPEYPGEAIIKSVNIPIVSPSLVLETPAPSDFFSKTLKLKAVPYFFNVSDLSFLKFSWKVNDLDVAAAEDPQNLIINVNPDAAPGSALEVSAIISNPAGYFESASAKKSFVISD